MAGSEWTVDEDSRPQGMAMTWVGAAKLAGRRRDGG